MSSAPDRDPGDRLRVAIVTQSLDDGGLERLVQTLALNVGSEFEPGVFALRELGVYKGALDEAGVPVLDCRESRVRIRGVPLRLIAELRRFRPDVIHSHSGTWVPCSVAKTFLRSPKLLFTEHGRYPPEPLTRALVEKWCAARTDMITAVSTPVADYITGFLGLETAPRVIANGIDLERFAASRGSARPRLRTEWGIGPEDILFAFVGRMVEVKNHAGLLAAVAAARSRSPALRVALFGQGPLEAQVREHARRLGLESHVLFMGFREDVSDCLLASDAFVLPSTTEGMPLSVLEALAAGLPIVATRVGGVPEVLGEPPAGILVEPGSVGELADAMAGIAESGALRARLGRDALERSRAFGIDVCARRYADVYRQLATA